MAFDAAVQAHHAAMLERGTLDGRVKPGHGVWGGLGCPLNTHTALVAICRG